MFKLQAMSKWWTTISQDFPDKQNLPPKRQQRFEPRMQMDYSIGLTLLTEELKNLPQEWKRFPTDGSKPKPKVDVMTICNYKPDPTSNTVLESPLPQMTPQNHQ